MEHMEENLNMICSRCGKEIGKNNLFVDVAQAVALLNETDEGIIERSDNVGDTTREYLCEDCFKEYCDKINELTESSTQKRYVNMVEVIDDVQFGDN